MQSSAVFRWTFFAILAGCFTECRCETDTPQSQTKQAQNPAALDFRQRYLRVLADRAGACTSADPKAVTDMLAVRPAGSFDVGKSVAKGRLGFDPASADACLSFLRGAPCATVFAILDEQPTAPNACQTALVGNVKSGGACYAAMECGAGSFCDATDLRCPGACKPLVPLGSTCEANDTCADGTDCRCIDGACSHKICKARLTKGERCDTTEAASCAEGLYCVPKGARGAGHCAAKDMTEPCATSEACLPPARCIGLKDVERPGRCSLPKKLGEACADGALECVDFSACIHGVCTAWNGVGGTCGNVPGGKEQTQCVGGWCDMSGGTTTGVGQCKPFRHIDDGCIGEGFLDFECGPGRCDRLLHKCVMPCSAR